MKKPICFIFGHVWNYVDQFHPHNNDLWCWYRKCKHCGRIEKSRAGWTDMFKLKNAEFYTYEKTDEDYTNLK